MAKPIPCPLCGQTERVEKVSMIYLTGISLSNRSPAARSLMAEITSNSKLDQMPTATLRALGRKLAPPASPRRAPMRPIHPDLVVLAFGLIAPVFLYGILTSQASMLPLALAILAVFLGFYLWKRRQMIDRFELQQATQNAAEERIKRGIERWIKLYYCAQDDGIFEPGKDQLVPTDQMLNYLLNE